MADAKDKKTVKVFSNEVRNIRVKYDFDDDAGAIGVIDLFEADEAMTISHAKVKVKTAVTSAGAPTVEIGVKGGDTDAVLPATLKGALLINTSIPADSASDDLYMAAGDILSMEIKVAALTAGVIELELDVSQF